MTIFGGNLPTKVGLAYFITVSQANFIVFVVYFEVGVSVQEMIDVTIQAADFNIAG
jgi:hypothetical protein